MIWSQIVTLGHFGKSFDLLIDRPETLAIILAFLITPDFLKKWLSMRYGTPQK